MGYVAKVRTDLRYGKDPDDETRFIVKDPLRATFHRFNALQVEMMLKLDGKRSAEELTSELGTELGYEVSLDSIERFVIRLEQSLLLDVSSYRSEPRVRRKVRAALAAKGIISRGKVPAAFESEEALLMQEGLRQVETGDPCLAAGWFVAALELNPLNEHARVALDTIHEVFFRQRRLVPSYVVMFPLWNPDRFLGWLDGKVGRWIFSPLAIVIAFLAVVVTGYGVQDLRPPQVGPLDVFLAYFLGIFVWLLLHELSHGLACKHYGGKVDEVGIILMWGISWAAYCDVSDSYFFKDKRHKILTSLAGPFQFVIEVCILTIYLHLTPDGFPLRGVAFVQLLLGSLALLYNLIPLVKFDSYYALSEWLEIPNLRERSFRYLAVLVQRHLLGIVAVDPEPTPRERTIFFLYGVSAGLFTTFYIFGIVFHFLLPLAEEYLGTLGLTLMGLYVLAALKNVILTPAIAFARFLWTNRSRLVQTWRPAAVLGTVLLFVAALSYPSPLLIDGEAYLEPATRGLVHAKTAGIVDAIRVREGDLVHAGDVIAELKNDDLLRRRARAFEQLAAAQLSLQMFKVGAREEELHVARARLYSASVAYSFEKRVATRARALEKEGLSSVETSENALRMSAASYSQADVARRGLDLVRAGHRDEDIAAAEALVVGLEAQLEDLDRRLDHLLLRAPSDGRVVGHRIEERLHEQLMEGDVFCEVHDIHRVRIEIHLPAYEPLSDVVVGSRLVARAWGRPSLELAGVVERVAPKTSEARRVVVQSALVDADGWTSGGTGHGRIYGAPRSLLYQLLARPVLRFVGYETWRFWG